jgi:FtsH-binding integral membrane protein
MSQEFTEQQLAIATAQTRFMAKVFSWMTLALIITGGISFLISGNIEIMNLIFSNSMVVIGLFIAQILSVGSLAIFVNKLSAAVATFIFVLYATLTGITLSTIFIVYTSASIASTFFITGATFGVMAVLGFVTGRDLSKLGSILMMALIGMVIASIANWFMKSETIYWITTYTGILIFTGLIAYDTQKIKGYAVISPDDEENYQKASIMGALSLYLDFINLFLLLLRLFGRRK